MSFIYFVCAFFTFIIHSSFSFLGISATRSLNTRLSSDAIWFMHPSLLNVVAFFQIRFMSFFHSSTFEYSFFSSLSITRPRSHGFLMIFKYSGTSSVLTGLRNGDAIGIALIFSVILTQYLCCSGVIRLEDVMLFPRVECNNVIYKISHQILNLCLICIVSLISS